MLRVFAISGEELAALPLEESSDVLTLKRQLHKVYGFPPRFRQRILHLGSCLEDDVALDSPMDLQLVLLTYLSRSQTQVEEFMAMANEGPVNQVERMLQLPLEPNLDSMDSSPPLMCAAARGRAAVVQLLLEARAHANSASIFGRSALAYASNDGHVEVVKLLLEAAADVNLADHRRNTALIWACMRGHATVARVLLEASADKDSTGRDGTALDAARVHGHLEVANLFSTCPSSPQKCASA